MKTFLKLSTLGLLAAAVVLMPLPGQAQNTNKPPKKASVEETKDVKKAVAHPFKGKLAEVDKLAKTITVGKSKYQVTSETKITKNGKPATLADGVVGEDVSGYVKPNDEGKLVATKVTFGKVEKSAEKKSDKSEKKQQP